MRQYLQHCRVGLLVILVLICLPTGSPLVAVELRSLSGAWRFELDPAGWAGRNTGSSETCRNGSCCPARPTRRNSACRPGQSRTLMGLYRPNAYAGPAWYQRDIDVPESWRDKRVVLFLERIHWETQVWIDGRLAGTAEDSLVTPHVHDLGRSNRAGTG